MVRKFLYAAALVASSVVGLSTPASAQSFGSVTLSFGGPRYGVYDAGYYGYRAHPRYLRNGDWRARDRWERRLRWQRERAWRQRAWRERRWHDDRFRGRDWRYRGY